VLAAQNDEHDSDTRAHDQREHQKTPLNEKMNTAHSSSS